MFPGLSDTKDRVRQAIDIVDLVGQHIDLRRQGRIYVGLCPWHTDSRPSLQVNPDRQSWKCWVCNLGGDIFSFVMQREGIEFREAFEMLAEQAGITLGPAGKPVVPGSPDDKVALYRAMAWACQQYHECLLNAPEGASARDYLAKRGISADSIQTFRLGFAPAGWQWLLDRAANASISTEILNAVGLVLRSEKSGRWLDRFRGRAIFPIFDLQSRPIALGGRILPELADEKSAKYINSPETRLFSKSEQLYGLNVARDAVARDRNVMVMEGYTDVVIAHQAGIHQAVAVLGTALGPRHIPVLRRFTDRITLILDGDDAGQRRANEILELFIAHQIDLRIVTLPDKLDPCDFVLQFGRDALLERVGRAPDAWEHRIRMETHDLDPLRDTHRANRALESLLATLAQASQSTQVAQSAQAAHRLRELQILNRLAREFHLDEAELRNRVTERRSKQATNPVSTHVVPRTPPIAAPTAPSLKQSLEQLERDLFEMMLQHPMTVAAVLDQIHITQLRSVTARDLYRHFVQLYEEEITPDFHHVMLAVDDPQLKNLLVEMDEEGRRKSKAAHEQLLVDLIDAFERRNGEDSLRRSQAALETNQLSEAEQRELLQAIIQNKRKLTGERVPSELADDTNRMLPG